MLELDKRIINKCHPYDCFSNVEEVSQYSNGWFSNNLEYFTNLDNTTFGPLTAITDSNYPFQSEKGFFKYFLPVCMVKIRSLKKEEIKFRPYTFEDFHQKVDKKKFRPFEMQEFKDNLPKMMFSDEVIHFRDKATDTKFSLKFVGEILDGSDWFVCLGTREYSLKELFEDFEYLDKDGEWNTFGVEE